MSERKFYSENSTSLLSEFGNVVADFYKNITVTTNYKNTFKTEYNILLAQPLTPVLHLSHSCDMYVYAEKFSKARFLGMEYCYRFPKEPQEVYEMFTNLHTHISHWLIDKYGLIDLSKDLILSPSRAPLTITSPIENKLNNKYYGKPKLNWYCLKNNN